MSNKLGELLVEDGLLTQAQLEATLKNQVIYGGRLGTNLMEMGYLTEEELARFVSDKLEIPCTTKEQLTSVPPETIQLIPKEVADKYKVIPLGRDKKRLTLAMLDPADLSVIDAISFITGFYISPMNAPEVSLVLALEKYYGIKPEMRYFQITGKKCEPPELTKGEELVDLGPITSPEKTHVDEPEMFDFSLPVEEEKIYDIEDVIETAVEPILLEAAEAEPSQTEPLIPEEPVGMKPVMAEPFKAEAVEDGPVVAEIAGQEPVREYSIKVESVRIESASEKPVYAEPAKAEPVKSAPAELTLEIVAELLAEAQDRDEIAKIITSYLGSKFDRVVIFMIKGTMAEGWRGLRNNRPIPDIDNMQIPLDEPSVLKIVNDGSSFYLGPVPDTPANAGLLAGMGGGAPSSALMVPLMMRGRVVAIIYADGGTEPVESRLAMLQKLAGKATIAFEILILKNKLLMN